MDDDERLRAAAEQEAEPGAILLCFCESPIEVLLGSFLLMTLEARYGAAMCLPAQISARPDTEMLLIPQLPWMQYRVDFAVRIPSEPPRFLFVECDGRDFHSSPEQVEHDQKRDQEMLAAGQRVVRFTGSEITRDPWACAGRVVGVIEFRCL